MLKFNEYAAYHMIMAICVIGVVGSATILAYVAGGPWAALIIATLLLSPVIVGFLVKS
jgi:hypothetical protein